MPATKQRPRRLSDAQLEQLLALTTNADSVELKLTVPDSERRSTVTALAAGKRAIRKLYSKEQRAFFTAHAPDGIGLDDLPVLGPITVLKLKFSPEGYGGWLVAELWFYPDGSRILERSTKCVAIPGHPGRRRDTGLPEQQGRGSPRRAADQDQDGPRVLLSESGRRSHGVAGLRQGPRAPCRS
jgi:hypothetical protein